MFETSVVTARAAAANRASLLTFSVTAHSAIVLGAIALSIAAVDLPSNAPKAYERPPMFVPITVPPQLGNGAAAPRPAAQPQTPPPAPAQQTAPPAIPESTPPAAASSAGEGPSPASGAPAQGGGGVGVPWGVEGGAGPLDSPSVAGVASAPAAPAIYQISGEVKAPVLLHKVEPAYPAQLVRNGIPATVVVRCVIDRNGRVRDPEVVVAALAPFNAAVLAAVQQWRFKPGSLRGEAVEVYLDLTVTFRVTR